MNRSGIVAAALVAAVVIAVAASVFAVPSADGTIQACYQRQGGGVRLVDTPSQCGKSESWISWNQKGVTGDTGAQGPQGPQGNQGGQGSQGEQGIQGLQGVQGPAGQTGVRSGVADLATGAELPISLPLWGGTATLRCELGGAPTGDPRSFDTNQAIVLLVSDSNVPMQLYAPGWPYADTEWNFLFTLGYELTAGPTFPWFSENGLRAIRNNVTFAFHAMVYVTHDRCRFSYRLEETQNS